MPAPADREQWPAHIKKLVLPPAWTDVRISLDPKSDLQAMGRDAKGRPQYVYSERFRDSRAADKFKRVAALDKKLTAVQARVAKGAQSKDERVREHAECLQLIMETGGSARQRGRYQSREAGLRRHDIVGQAHHPGRQKIRW